MRMRDQLPWTVTYRHCLYHRHGVSRADEVYPLVFSTADAVRSALDAWYRVQLLRCRLPLTNGCYRLILRPTWVACAWSLQNTNKANPKLCSRQTSYLLGEANAGRYRPRPNSTIMRHPLKPAIVRRCPIRWRASCAKRVTWDLTLG